MLSKKHIICHLSVIFPWCFPTFSSFHHHFSSCWFSPWKSRGCSKHSYILRGGNGYFSPPDLPNHLPGDAASPQRSGGETSRGDLDRVTWYLGRRWRIPLIFRGLTDISLGFFFLFPQLWTKSLKMVNSKRHAMDGRTYHRISNNIPIREPMGLTMSETCSFLMTIKGGLNQSWPQCLGFLRLHYRQFPPVQSWFISWACWLMISSRGYTSQYIGDHHSPLWDSQYIFGKSDCHWWIMQSPWYFHVPNIFSSHPTMVSGGCFWWGMGWEMGSG